MPFAALLSGRLARCALVALVAFAILTMALSAQEPGLGRCTKRPTAVHGELYVDNLRWCVESILHEPNIEALSFTALEIAPDGTLYATRPLSGAVMAIRDRDGDALPDTMETFAAGLTRPNGLAYYDNALYVSGGAHIYRITPAGAVDTIVDDLPSGTGFWTGGITIADDGRLYVAVGAPLQQL